jgi:hypothetical protein
VTAGDAEPEMKPAVTHFQALFTPVRGTGSHVVNSNKCEQQFILRILLMLVSQCHGFRLIYGNMRLDPGVDVCHHDFLVNIIQQIVIVSLIEFQSFVR